MEQRNFKKQLWLGIGIVAGSVVVFGIAFYLVAGDIGNVATAITRSRSDIATQNAIIGSYSDLKENAGTAANYQTAMDKLLAEQDELITFPSQLDGIGRSNGVDVTFSFQGDPVLAGQNKVGYINFRLSAIGSLDNVTAFLKDVEVSVPILLSRVNSFDLTQNGPNYTLAAQGKVFFK